MPSCSQPAFDETRSGPDFDIGAHAETAGFTRVTRDVARYRTYFPNLKLITPED